MTAELFQNVFSGGDALAKPKPLSEMLERRSVGSQPGWLSTPTAAPVPRGAMAASQVEVSQEPEPEPEPEPVVEAPPEPPPPDPEVTAQLREAIERLAKVEASIASGPDIVELSMAVAQAVLRQELVLQPEVVVSAVQVALEALRGEAATRIRLHPTMVEAVRTARPDLEPEGIELVADPSLGEGGCIVESAHQALDASVEERLERFRSAFAASLSGGEG